jgi:predicted RND superfamily exporter protein
VLFSYFQCLTILRFCLKRSVISQDHAQRVGERISLQLLANLVLTYSSKILFATVAFSVAGIVAVSQLTIDDNVYQYFPANHSLRQATTLIDQHFYGSMQLVYSIDSGTNFGAFEQQYVNRLNDFTAWLETQSGVAKITSRAAILSANKSRFAKVQQFFQGSKSSDYDYQHLISKN